MSIGTVSRRSICIGGVLALPSFSLAGDLTKAAESLLRDNDKFIVSEILSESNEVSIITLLCCVCAIFAIVGLGVGAAGGWRQALASSLKIPLLHLGTVLVCLPFMLLGSLMTGTGMDAPEIVRFVLLGMVTEALVMLSLTPIIVFFSCQSRYDFTKLLIVVAFALSGVVAMVGLIDSMAVITAARGTLPTDVMWLFKIWIATFGFVGMQMAWMLRPCIGSPELEFEWFRPRDQSGNFYTAVMQSAKRLYNGPPPPPTPGPIGFH